MSPMICYSIVLDMYVIIMGSSISNEEQMAFKRCTLLASRNILVRIESVSAFLQRGESPRKRLKVVLVNRFGCRWRGRRAFQ